METELLEDDLAEITRRLDEIADVPEPPLTTLQAIGRAQNEGYWQRLMLYFLTSTEPHGLEDEFLDQVLNALGDHPDVEFAHSRQDLESVEIATEVSADGRPVDMLLWAEGEWFICIEMKIASPEHDEQTLAYAASDSFDEGELSKEDIPEEGHHYLYLAPEDANSPESEQFVRLSWKWLAAEIRAFLNEGFGRHPRRTEAQLNDFADTITSELTMTDHKKSQFAKVSLAAEFSETLEDISNACEAYTKEIRTEWPDSFVNRDPVNWDSSWQPDEIERKHKIARIRRASWWSTDDVRDERDFYVQWEVKLAVEFVSRGVLKHRIVAYVKDEEYAETFISSYTDEMTQSRVDEVLESLQEDSTKHFDADPEWNDAFPFLVTGDYRYEISNNGFVETAVEAFEDMEPIFEIITECIPSESE